MWNVSQLLTQLNSQQQQAVIHAEGPAVILAGAGSGKTRVLTSRVAWLLEQKLATPEQILLVTFTNKAAQEMNQRVEKLAGTRLPFSGTFHRICALILRRHGHHLHLSPNYTIYDSQDQDALIKSIYKDKGFDNKKYNWRVVQSQISQAKNNMLTYNDLADQAASEFDEHVVRVFQLYQRQLRQNQAVDFDDLLLETVRLFTEIDQVAQLYQDQFSHVLVDEYQDTNTAQYQLTKHLALPQNNVYVVGDFSQSIYAWRGADYRNLQHLKTEFPQIKEYRLEQNYRSTQAILDAATQVISQNTGHPILSLWTEKTEFQPITLLENSDNDTEASNILHEIKYRLQDYEYRDIAILYRVNAQSRSFEEACVHLGIPYQLVGGFKFYERAEVKDVLAYLRVLLNPVDLVSVQRLQKLGKRRYQKFHQWAQKQAAPLTPLQALEEILRVTGYLEKYDEEDPQDQARIENIQELLNVSSQFQDIATFLENVALVQDKQLADVENSNGQNAISMMSLHSAKGLEFPVVFLVGLEEGLLPHSRSVYDPDQLEEERRLCYVGITRAQEKLYLSYARKRWQYGSSSQTLPSRFISEINSSLIKRVRVGEKGYSATDATKRRLVIDDEALDSVLAGEMDLDAFLDS